MSHMSGAWRQETSLSPSQAESQLTWQRAAFLIGLGVAAVFLHATLRWDLKLPGHHGLEWMALLIVGRLTSRYRWSASLTSLGAGTAALAPLWGLGDPFAWLIYLLPGPIIDLAFLAAPRWRNSVLFLALLAGLAHATKPLLRVCINEITGWPYGSLLWGVAYPVATHILFGAAGALIGLGVLVAVERRRRR